MNYLKKFFFRLLPRSVQIPTNRFFFYVYNIRGFNQGMRELLESGNNDVYTTVANEIVADVEDTKHFSQVSFLR